jgi:hypothetical protein
MTFKMVELPVILVNFLLLLSPTTAQTPFTPLSTSMPPSATSTLPITKIQPDPWTCATKNLTQYLAVPTPSGALLTALLSYGSVLKASCTSSQKYFCPQPSPSEWCSFSGAVSSDVLREYTAYSNAAKEGWSSTKGAVQSVSKECQETWRKARGWPRGEWLDLAVIFAECAGADSSSGGGGSFRTWKEWPR